MVCVENDDSPVMVNAIEGRRQQNYGRGRGYNSKVCTYCGKTGHMVETCYKKHGYPHGFPKWKGGNATVNVSQSTEESDSRFDDSAPVKDSPATAVLTQDEYKALMALLRASPSFKTNEAVQESHTISNVC